MKQDEDLPLPKLPASADGRPWLLEPKILKEHSVSTSSHVVATSNKILALVELAISLFRLLPAI